MIAGALLLAGARPPLIVVVHHGAVDVLLAQLPALIGVIVGAAGSYIATHLVERARWKRQQATRWDEERRKAYAEYAHSVKAVIQMSARVAASRGINTRYVNDTDVDEGLKELAHRAFERSSKWEPVLLLGDDATIEAGRAWHSLAFRLEEFAYASRDDPEEWAKTYAEAGMARDRFYARARRDLGIRVEEENARRRLTLSGFPEKKQKQTPAPDGGGRSNS